MTTSATRAMIAVTAAAALLAAACGDETASDEPAPVAAEIPDIVIPTSTLADIVAPGPAPDAARPDGSEPTSPSADTTADPAERRMEPFMAVSTGPEHSCGVCTGGSAECWGRNDDGETDAPEGSFNSVSSGGRHSCGVRAGGNPQHQYRATFRAVPCRNAIWRVPEREPGDSRTHGMTRQTVLDADSSLNAAAWHRRGCVRSPA